MQYCDYCGHPREVHRGARSGWPRECSVLDCECQQFVERDENPRSRKPRTLAEFRAHRKRTTGKKNPPATGGLITIYDRAEKIFMRGNHSPGVKKQEKFFHPFKPGARLHGVPKGAELRLPNGQRVRLAKNAVLIKGPNDLWGQFNAKSKRIQ